MRLLIRFLHKHDIYGWLKIILSVAVTWALIYITIIIIEQITPYFYEVANQGLKIGIIYFLLDIGYTISIWIGKILGLKLLDLI